MVEAVKVCRMLAVAGRPRRAWSAGVGQASGEETAGRVRLGVSACVIHGDLRVGHCLPAGLGLA